MVFGIKKNENFNDDIKTNLIFRVFDIWRMAWKKCIYLFKKKLGKYVVGIVLDLKLIETDFLYLFKMMPKRLKSIQN